MPRAALLVQNADKCVFSPIFQQVKKIKKYGRRMPAGCRRCNPAGEYEGEEPSCFSKKNKEKIKKIRQATPAGCRRCNPAGEYEGEEPSCFYFYFIFFCLRRPAFRRWTPTRSRTLTARKMLNAFFRILLLRNILLRLCKVCASFSEFNKFSRIQTYFLLR